jgi:hypothetical protein
MTVPVCAPSRPRGVTSLGHDISFVYCLGFTRESVKVHSGGECAL